MPENPPAEHHDNQPSGRQLVYREAFSGPLPPPAVLEKYNQILPGAAERILQMTEEQSRHRRSLESQVIASDIRRADRGLQFGLVIGISGLTAAVVIGIVGQPWAGGLLGIGTIASLVGTFVYGSQQRRKEREDSEE